MNTDFRLSTSYFTHPKVKRLRRRLGAEGCFAHVALLSFAALHRPDGRLGGFDAEDIADGAGYPGDAQAFIEALVDLRLLDRDADGTLSVHDWAEHNTWAAEAQQRSETARANAHSRWDKERAGKAGPAKAEPKTDAKKAADGADAAAMPPHVQAVAGADAAAMPPLCSSPILSSPLLPYPSEAFPDATTPSDSDARGTDPPPPPATAQGPRDDEACREEVVALLLAQGISEGSARELVLQKSCEAIRRHVADFAARLEERRARNKATDDPAGLLFRAIQDGWGRPEGVKRRIAEEETRRKGEEAERRRAEDQVRRDALMRADQARLAEAWDALPQTDRDEITVAQQGAMLRVQPYKDQHARSPDGFWGKPRVQEALLKRCHAALIERNARWPHQVTTVYRKGDPLPAKTVGPDPASAGGTQGDAEADRELAAA